MISTHYRHSSLWMILVLCMTCASTCRGDLFALLSGGGGIVRMNSTTGAVIDTYSLSGGPYPSQISVSSGLAFDGRHLYVNQRLNFGEELWRFEIATGIWFPIGFLDTFSFGSPGNTWVSGLASMPGPSGEGALIAVTRRLPVTEPSYVVQYGPLLPFLIPSFPVLPVGTLPDNIDATGVDYDPVSNELWISAQEVEGTTRTAVLLRTDLGGAVLQTLTPSLGNVVPRGLAFDEGQLFVGARNLPGVNEIYQVDRTTGAILNTFIVPGTSIVAALTGGTVVPEPATIVCGLLVGVMATCSRRGSGRRERLGD